MITMPSRLTSLPTPQNPAITYTTLYNNLYIQTAFAKETYTSIHAQSCTTITTTTTDALYERCVLTSYVRVYVYERVTTSTPQYVTPYPLFLWHMYTDN